MIIINPFVIHRINIFVEVIRMRLYTFKRREKEKQKKNTLHFKQWTFQETETIIANSGSAANIFSMNTYHTISFAFFFHSCYYAIDKLYLHFNFIIVKINP